MASDDECRRIRICYAHERDIDTHLKCHCLWVSKRKRVNARYTHVAGPNDTHAYRTGPMKKKYEQHKRRVDKNNVASITLWMTKKKPNEKSGVRNGFATLLRFTFAFGYGIFSIFSMWFRSFCCFHLCPNVSSNCNFRLLVSFKVFSLLNQVF